MRYVVRKSWWDSDIQFRGENGDASYLARKRLMSFTSDLLNADRRRILTIRKLPLQIAPEFEILRDESVVAKITSEFDPQSWYRVEIGGVTAMSIRANSWHTALISCMRRAGSRSSTSRCSHSSSLAELTMFDERQEEIAVVATAVVLWVESSD